MTENAPKDEAAPQKDSAAAAPITKEAFDALQAKLGDLEKRAEELAGAKKYAFDQYHELKAKLDLDAATKAQQKEEDLKKQGKHEEIAESYKAKIAELEQAIKERDNKYSSEKLDSAARQIAMDAGAEGYNVDHLATLIRNRLDMNDGQVGVLDEAGKMTIKTVKDFVTDIQNNERYFSLLTDRKSSGSGASGNVKAGSASAQKKYEDMTEAEQVQLKRENPILFYDLLKAYKSNLFKGD